VPDELDTLLSLKGVGRKTANLVVTLGPGESALESLISGAMRNRAHFLKLPLGLLPPLFRRIRLLVTNDTGPRHIGVAMDRPVVVLFGPSDVRFSSCRN
jgi:heptosyltransferase-2